MRDISISVDIDPVNPFESGVLTQNYTALLQGLMESFGWHDLRVDIATAESKEQSREQNLRWAIEHYLDEQNPSNRVRLISALDETLKSVQAEYDHAIEQQQYYQEQTMQEAQKSAQQTTAQSHSYYHQMRSWATRGIKDFFGSTPEQQAQKYAEIAENRRTKIDQLSRSLQVMAVESDQEVFVAVAEDDCGGPIISSSICDAPLGQLDLSDLISPQGLVINGAASEDNSGNSVSGVGDMNGDGLDDLVIGASLALPNGKTDAGTSYVIFGSPMLE